MPPFEVCRKEEGQKGEGMKGEREGEEGRKRQEHCEEENFVFIVVLKENTFR